MSSPEEPYAAAEPVPPHAGNRATPHGVSPAQPDGDPLGFWKDRLTLATVAVCLVIAATSWYLLKELAPILRPLLMAVFLCYVVIPGHRRLTRHIPAAASTFVLAGAAIGVLVL